LRHPIRRRFRPESDSGSAPARLVDQAAGSGQGHGWPAGGEHRLDNGLLLRSDVHTLYDRGYLGIDPKHRLLVSPRLRAEFGNGDQFYAQAGEIITLPDRRADRPNEDFLEWHLDETFQAS
jgi:putative restriction endonuclease